MFVYIGMLRQKQRTAFHIFVVLYCSLWGNIIHCREHSAIPECVCSVWGVRLTRCIWGVWKTVFIGVQCFFKYIPSCVLFIFILRDIIAIPGIAENELGECADGFIRQWISLCVSSRDSDKCFQLASSHYSVGSEWDSCHGDDSAVS